MTKNQVIAEGQKSDNIGLFELRIQPILEKALLMKIQRTSEEWHRTLGHASIQQLKLMEQNASVENMKIVAKDIDRPICATCPQGKGVMASHPQSLRERARAIGELVHADLIGVRAAELRRK